MSIIREQDPAQYGISADMIAQAMDVSFEDALDASFGGKSGSEGMVAKGIVVNIEGDYAIIDVGMKSEGRVPLREFAEFGKTEELKVGDAVDVYIESLDGRDGSVQLSREKARREEAMDVLEAASIKNEKVKGIIFGKVRGGFTVDVNGILAFMPGSQLDARPIRDVTPFMNTPIDLMILKMDRKRSNLIVSRRAIMDESRSGVRDEILAGMKEGNVLEGVVKNITDYGAFVDLGGVDGLLHITDIAWHRINHPSEVLTLGETLKVQVIRFNEETKRVSLGLKQMQSDPWKSVGDRFPIGAVVTGKVTNITDYGAFVDLGNGVEGLIHVSEMSWTRKNIHPGKILSTSQEVEVMVLEIDQNKRRISLGYKQCQANPWQAFSDAHPVGSTIEGAVRSVTDFGLFVGLTEEIDGLVHMSDISWDKAGETALREFKKGDTVKAKILSIDSDKERISLGMKQLERDPFASVADQFNRGDKADAKVIAVEKNGITVELAEGVESFIKRADLGVTKEEQDPERFKEGSTVEVMIVRVNKKDRKVSASVRAIDLAAEKEAMDTYGSAADESASTLGDALAAAMNRAKSAE